VAEREDQTCRERGSAGKRHYGVTEDGVREVVGPNVGESEAEAL
jgi:hypothetical protein